MKPAHDTTDPGPPHARCLVSLQTLAGLTDAHATTVRRWLRDAGIQPVVVGRGRSGAIRYRWRDIHDWLETLEQTE